MAYENLLKSVEESAQEKERELRENAQKQADAIRSAAKKQAEEIQETHHTGSRNLCGYREEQAAVPCERQDQGAGPEKPGEGVRGRL